MARKKNKLPLLLRLVQWAFPILEQYFPPLARRLFITIFFSPLNYSVPEKEKATEKEAEKFTVRIHGKKIQCYAWGSGPTVLLVHGWAGRATQFRSIIPALVREKYRVIGFDGPAHGNSDGRSTSILEFEETFREIYAATGTPVAIIAHSFGGSAVLYAAMNGLEVKKLINIASPTIGDEIIATYLRRINGSPATGEYFKKYILETTGRSFDEFAALYSVRNLPEPLDLLLVHDENDPEVSISHAYEMIKVYPRAMLYQTQGLGHTRILRDEGVVRKCLSFIKT